MNTDNAIGVAVIVIVVLVFPEAKMMSPIIVAIIVRQTARVITSVLLYRKFN